MTQHLSLPIVVSPWLAIVLATLFLLAVCAFLVVMVIRRRPVPGEEFPTVAPMDVESFGAHGPEGLSPRLTLYHQPVRLALVVIAPVGRDARLPSTDEMPHVVESLVPGLMGVLNHHRPEYQPWPPQLSTAGFTALFAKMVPLPGHRGKGTPWSSVAGPFEYEGQRLLAGIVVRAATANSVGELTVNHPGQWFDLLRVQ